MSGESAGRPEATKAELLCGNRMVQEAKAARAKVQGKTSRNGISRQADITRRIPALPGVESELTWTR